MEDIKLNSEIQIMKRVIESDEKALEELYDLYSQILYTLINKVVNNKDGSEEVLADVFLLVWKKGKSFDFTTQNLYAWLVLLAHNKAVDRKKRDSSPDDLPEYSDEYEDKFIIPKLSKSIEAQDLESAFSVKDKFENALNKLTGAQKYVINLAYYEGKTQNDIANQLNIPLPTVKSKI
ncbi:MAG: sigma-70 family RNA polymerase sigma factor [Ignavibacteria bacterium]|nr:sigma-70 family RNA polymerase sigma factor [Ignavibacteria bacterium]